MSGMLKGRLTVLSACNILDALRAFCMEHAPSPSMSFLLAA